MAAEKLGSSDDDGPISVDGGGEDNEPISLVDADERETPSVRAFGSAAVEKLTKRLEFKRPLNVTGQGATRCRVFHSKIATASLEYMETQINGWLDSEEIEVKHVGHVIGIMEGKTPEPNVIVILWY